MTTTNITISDIPPGIATPDRVESRLGTLNFTDGVPDVATAQKLFDELDYVHAVPGIHQRLCGREPTGAAQGIQGRRRQRQRGAGDIRVDGCQVLVPDGQRRHLLSLVLSGPEQRAARRRNAAGYAGHR